MSLRLLIMCGLATVATPINATEGADCVVDLVGEQRKAEFFEAYRADVRPSEALQAALRAAMQACTDTHGWSEAAQQAARRYTTARILYDRLILASPFSQADLDRLATAFDTVDDATALRWFEQGIGEADNERLAVVLAQSGVAVDESNGPFVGEFFAARYMAISARAAFAAL
jgi:hypothetical protein